MARLAVLLGGVAIAAPSLSAQTPHLVVVLTAEQFRADYLDRYYSSFSRAGFHRLISEGTSYKRCRFNHAANFAAPNAAILATGAYPRVSGIAGDRWYDRLRQEVVSAVGPVGEESAVWLAGSTAADELNLASGGESKIVAISGRAAPAVLSAGRKPAGCYWMGAAGDFGSSSAFSNELPRWVKEFNEKRPVSRWRGRKWLAADAAPNAKPLRLLPGPDEKFIDTFLAFFRSSPFAMARTLDFASTAIREMNLGGGTHPDLLYVNLSAPALLALEAGAGSPLMRDMVLQLDRELAGFLNKIDDAVGLDRTAIVFTGLHGTPHTAEAAAERGLASGRIQGETVAAAMNQALAADFGSGPAVEKYVYPYVTFNERFSKLGEDRRRQALHTAGQAALALKGIAAYYSPAADSGYEVERMSRSWRSGRSGDLMLAYEPFFGEFINEPRGAGNGSMHRYDSDVPLILYGPRFRSMQLERTVDAASVAPTIAALLNVAAPSSAGTPALTDAFRAIPAPAPPVGPALPSDEDIREGTH